MVIDHPGFELTIRIAEGDGDETISEQVQAVFDSDAADLPEVVDIEHWTPRPVRSFGTVRHAFVTSVGVMTLTKLAAAQISGLLNEVAVVLGGTAGADLVTIDVGGEIFNLSDVTPDMLERWLPPES